MKHRLNAASLALLLAIGLGAPAVQAAPADVANAAKPFPAIALEKRMRGEQATTTIRFSLFSVMSLRIISWPGSEHMYM